MIVLINPNLVALEKDPFTTGIVYMPLALAYAAASLREAGIPVRVIDAFAEKPYQTRREKQFVILGLKEDEVAERIPPEAAAVFIYAINLTNHLSTVALLRKIKQARPGLPVVILENTQAVSAYALRHVAPEFYKAGADYILTGESERRVLQASQAFLSLNGKREEVLRAIDGLGSPEFYTEPREMISDPDALSFPAWDLFPLENYWKLRFAHGPQSSRRYLPLLTSRGCPYPCKFCVVPATNNQRWRPRSAKNVVDEIEAAIQKYGVREFHIEDLDPTISDERIREICKEILSRKLNIVWKIAAGTKVETIRNEETVDWMAKAGCRYVSISPETGSPRLLKEMRKPFDLRHAVRIVKRMGEAGIRTQACFVLGYPGETEDDLRMTRDLVRDLTKKGVDEIALFIITPVPGSAIYGEFKGYESYSELNFSPAWRPDYARLNRFRLELYGLFLFWKLCFHPLKILRQPGGFLTRRFQTKMEMVPYRAMMLKYLALKAS